MLLHATSVVIDGQAVLLTGPSGSGKSDLALRLIDAGATLLADDQTELFIAANGDRDGDLMARPPASIAGLIEARHMGLISLPHIDAAPVALQVELAGADAVLQRLPEPQTVTWLGKTIPVLRLPAFDASTPAKIRLWLRHGIAQS